MKNRDFLNLTHLACAIGALVVGTQAQTADTNVRTAAKKRPNILFIFSDDHAPHAIGGHEKGPGRVALHNVGAEAHDQERRSELFYPAQRPSEHGEIARIVHARLDRIVAVEPQPIAGAPFVFEAGEEGIARLRVSMN